MPRIAILADIHANREALDAVMERLQDLNVDQTVLLGDLVGYGPDPSYVVDTAKAMVADGAIALLGNHDEAIQKGARGMNENARDAIAWTQGQLSGEQKTFLTKLPLEHRFGNMLFTHASAARTGSWPYIRSADAAADCLRDADARIVICGHTHVPAIFYAAKDAMPSRFTPLPNNPAPLFAGRRQIVVIGSVGQPRDGNPAACLGLLDTRAMEVTMYRIPYDSALTTRKIVAAKLPSWLGVRLQTGS
jgi:predicted phosphodiesterase